MLLLGSCYPKAAYNAVFERCFSIVVQPMRNVKK